MYEWSSKGCLIAQLGPAIGDNKGFANIAEAAQYWYSL